MMVKIKIFGSKITYELILINCQEINAKPYQIKIFGWLSPQNVFLYNKPVICI